MKRRHFTGALMVGAAAATASCANIVFNRGRNELEFDPSRYSTQTLEVNGQVMRVRAYENLPVVTQPLEPEYQALNLYVPEPYFHGKVVASFNARTAPIFLPNTVGGYMPAKPGTLRGSTQGPQGQPPRASASAVALSLGYVVAAPGARGRTLRTADGRWTGKAPAAIVDLKAAVRWLRYNAGKMPGNVERIISNGTSAGGALSALLGASGNHPAYEADLRALGAAPARDDIHAVSAYCPITNLAHADEAYEWQFEGIREYRNVAITMLDYTVQRQEVEGRLSDQQLALSAEMRAHFVDYVNGLGLRSANGERLTLQVDGRGSLRTHVESLLLVSAQQAQAQGLDLTSVPWLAWKDRQIVAADFGGYARAVRRMKAQPAFDGLALETGENQLFGDRETDKRHFTSWSASNSQVAGASTAAPSEVKAMDAMQQLLDPRSTVARHWRIRHGSADRDTSLAIPALLAAAARQRSAEVDLWFPWAQPHSGDYDLDQLFAWVKSVCSNTV